MSEHPEMTPRERIGRPRTVRLTVLVDAPLARFARAEAQRDYCSVSTLLAGLLAELRRQRRREGHDPEFTETEEAN